MPGTKNVKIHEISGADTGPIPPNTSWRLWLGRNYEKIDLKETARMGVGLRNHSEGAGEMAH